MMMEMVVEGYIVMPPMTTGTIITAHTSTPSTTSVVDVDILGAGLVTRQGEPVVLMEVSMTGLCRGDTPVSNVEHGYAASFAPVIATAVACQEQTTMISSITEETGDVAARGNINVAVNTVRPLAIEGWGRDAMLVEGIFRIIENMEPPWITINVLENAVVQFPNVEREMLRHTIMTILVSQRRCVVRLTRAGLRLGPRVDREGSAFVELDLDYADRYSNSH